MPFSADALTARLGLAEGVPHLSSNFMDSGVSQGETLNVTVGAGNFSVTFGTGVGEISTVAELQTALAGYPGGMGTASVDTDGNITLVASGNNTIEVIRRPRRSSSG